MKKALVLLLILAVAGGIFAQEGGELTWSGEVVSGFSMHFGDTGKSYQSPSSSKPSDDVAWITADDDDDDRYVKARLTALYEGEGYGLKLGMNGDYAGAQDGRVSFTNAYGWLNFGEILKVSAGMIDDAVWGVGGWVDYNEDTGIGMRLEITPIEGLNAGVMFQYPNKGHEAKSLGNWFLETVIGATYESDAFKINAFLKMFSEESDNNMRKDNYNSAAYNNKGQEITDMHVGLGFGITAIENLDVYLGFAFLDLQGEEDVAVLLGQNVDFQVSDALKVGIEAGEVICDGLKSVEIVPAVEFGINENLTVGAKIKFVMETDAADDLGFSTVNPTLWGKYTIGGGWIKGAYSFELKTEDFGDTLTHKFGVYLGTSF